jgi:GMP synthase (glutamine-hydrolysing)
MADETRGFYGVQFHPEVTHTPAGHGACCGASCIDICGCRADWAMRRLHRRGGGRDPRAGRRRDEVILGLSGGVDSSRWPRR